MRRDFLPAPALAAPLVLFCLSSCSRNVGTTALSQQDSLAIVRDNEAHRAAAHHFFATDPASPFMADTTMTFSGLRWFPIDPRYRGKSVLHRYDHPETVAVYGTQGDRRTMIRFGWFSMTLPGERNLPAAVRLNVYRSLPADETVGPGERPHLSVWFTDHTTGVETYQVGRYVNVDDLHPDPGHEYTIDLNKAYNPYCAYSDFYTCAVPRKDDHLDIAVRAGEMVYPRARTR